MDSANFTIDHLSDILVDEKYPLSVLINILNIYLDLSIFIALILNF